MARKIPYFYSGYIKDYFELIFSYVKPITENAFDSPDFESKFQGAITSTLLGTIPSAGQSSQHNAKDLFIANKLFRPFSEIADSYECLTSISAYISSFPIRNRKISRVSYLRYHIENYLSEMYILRERLDSFLSILDRSYRRSKEYPRIHIATETMRPIVNKAFESYVRVRGSHVHENRYYDEDITGLSTLELLTKGPDADFTKKINRIYRLAYKRIRNKWKTKITEDLVQIHALLNAFFEASLKTLSVNRELLFPGNLLAEPRKVMPAGNKPSSRQ